MKIVTGLSYSYGNKEIFEDFDLETSKNITIIHGPSGSGKTTLLKLIFGLYKPNSINSKHDFKKIGLILQEDSLAPWLTGMQNILAFVNTKEENVKSHELFIMVSEFINKKACQMSYGQRRMIELFRILLSNNELILLDEPFNFINKDNRKLFLDYLKKEKRQFIISTHFDDGYILENSEVFGFEGEAPYSILKKYENTSL